MSKWRIEGRRVMRGSQQVAQIRKTADGWEWKGFGHRRSGFGLTGELGAMTEAEVLTEILADVKYFWRYQRNKPLIIFHYKGGRKVEVW